MSKSIFITGTGTDIGKTYISGLIVKKLKEYGMNPGYFKTAVLSETCSIPTSCPSFFKAPITSINLLNCFCVNFLQFFRTLVSSLVK